MSTTEHTLSRYQRPHILWYRKVMLQQSPNPNGSQTKRLGKDRCRDTAGNSGDTSIVHIKLSANFHLARCEHSGHASNAIVDAREYLSAG